MNIFDLTNCFFSSEIGRTVETKLPETYFMNTNVYILQCESHVMWNKQKADNNTTTSYLLNYFLKFYLQLELFQSKMNSYRVLFKEWWSSFFKKLISFMNPFFIINVTIGTISSRDNHSIWIFVHFRQLIICCFIFLQTISRKLWTEPLLDLRSKWEKNRISIEKFKIILIEFVNIKCSWWLHLADFWQITNCDIL